jgi:sulfofructose kinase
LDRCPKDTAGGPAWIRLADEVAFPSPIAGIIVLQGGIFQGVFRALAARGEGMAAARRIICVGHAALDRIYRIEAFPPEPTKVRALEHIEAGGGMAANAAVAIARLGGRAELWSRTGDDAAGCSVRAGLQAERVDVRYLQGFEGARTSTSAIIVDRGGERLIVGQRDAGMPSGTSWLPLERVREADAVLGDLRWLEALRSVFARAKQESIPTVLDADLGAREALESILRLTDYAIFSAPALRELVPSGTDAERLAAVRALGPGYAGVTLGPEGYLWHDQTETRQIPAFPVTVTDTTGAGDAFHGALTLFLAEGRPVADCARLASAVAAMKCTRLGSRSGLPNRAELAAFLATHGA